MIPVIDLFAGPGGLNEGFTSAGGGGVFQSVISLEMEHWAHETLVLRAALRAADFPISYYEFLSGQRSWDSFVAEVEIVDAFSKAREESPQFELSPSTRDLSDGLIRGALSRAGVATGDPWVLIGGPPCQAYSLAGRSRRRGDKNFSSDKKHVLYREYLHILDRFRPTVFVMENVRGILTSKHHDSGIFEQILHDLSLGGAYEIRSFVHDADAANLNPADFVIHAERFGVPQQRQRVILLGIATGSGLRHPGALISRDRPVTVRDALRGLPAIRSQVSPRSKDSAEAWWDIRERARSMSGLHRRRGGRGDVPPLGREHASTSGSATVEDPVLASWLLDERLQSVVHHTARSHMTEDLLRYFYLAFRAGNGVRQPTVNELPPALAPKHRNVGYANTPFVDRFRVQEWDRPSSTVVAHISKDGHHYIHPDAEQMRSLTVREAARLQTFPDNYFFRGPRTAQYQQVGNAVPPLLAYQLGEKVMEILGMRTDSRSPRPRP